MRVKTLKSLTLYNYRYLFAYFITAVFAIYFLAWRLGSLPIGLSVPELASAARNINLSSFLADPTYPLHSLLQWASLQIFGVNSIAIRLPSVILATATVVILYNLLKKWFGKVTSLITTAVLLSADWFLFVARLGTGVIEFSFWFTLLLFSLIKLIEKQPKWLSLYAVAASFLLFSPFGVYAVITSTICLFICVMFRKRANEAHFAAKLAFGLLPLISLALIAWASFNNIDFLKSLVGINTLPTPFEFLKNVVLNSSGVAMIWPDNNPVIGPSGIFLIRFFEFTFMLFGLIMLWVTRVNRLGVVVITNAVVLALVSGFSSDARGGSLLIIPAAIFMTCGLRHFIHRWHRTFPKNPYARIALYMPLIIMIVAATTLHFQSFYVLWPRQELTRKTFTSDYNLLADELKNDGVCSIIGAPGEIKTLIDHSQTNCQTTFVATYNEVEDNSTIIYHGQSIPTKRFAKVKALTDGTSEDNVRWLVAEQK